MPTQLNLKWHRPLGGGVEQVLLTPAEPVNWQAGQFLELLVEGESGLYFTIASAPGGDIELHVETAIESGGGRRLLDHLANRQAVSAIVGEGECHVGRLPDDTSPLMLIASATGFSQVKAITEHYLVQHSNRPIHIYWTARSASGLYMAELAQCWADTYPNVHFGAVISENQAWDSGRHHLHACICEDFSDLSGVTAVCCGSPAMVYSTLDYLTAAGLDPNRFFSDMLQFAPRPAAAEV